MAETKNPLESLYARMAALEEENRALKSKVESLELGHGKHQSRTRDFHDAAQEATARAIKAQEERGSEQSELTRRQLDLAADISGIKARLTAVEASVGLGKK